MRPLVLGFGLFLFVLGSKLQSAPKRPKGPGPRGLRIASFNLAWFSGRPGKGFVPRQEADYERIARILRGLQADLLCLQEVVDEEALESITERMNRLARGKARYSFRGPDEAAIFREAERPFEQRMSVLYDKKVLRLKEVEFLDGLEAEGKNLIRPPLRVRVQVVGKPLDFDVVNVHLKSGVSAAWAREIRQREVKILADWIRQGREGQDPDLVLLGDFNAPRDDETLAALDEMADQGELVAVEDHLRHGNVGTHIPWEIGIDRIFLTKSLFQKAGVERGAAVFRFDDFMPGATETEGFCIRTRRKVRSAELRCDCPTPNEESQAVGDEDMGYCLGESTKWVKAANYLRVSDHRPIYWDLRIPYRR